MWWEIGFAVMRLKAELRSTSALFKDQWRISFDSRVKVGLFPPQKYPKLLVLCFLLSKTCFTQKKWNIGGLTEIYEPDLAFMSSKKCENKDLRFKNESRKSLKCRMKIYFEFWDGILWKPKKTKSPKRKFNLYKASL